MIEFYKPKHFDLRELVPPQVWADRGERCIEIFEPGALITLDQLREAYGPMVVNNWHYYKKNSDHWSMRSLRKWSGLRIKGCPYGTIYSQHRYGRAFDSLFRDYTAQQVREDVLANPDLFPFINAIELDVDWFHFDTRNCERIKAFKP